MPEATFIYLDYNATAPLLPEVSEALHAIEASPLNPSSVHKAGRQAKKLVEDARREIAQACSVFPHEVLFFGSATEANNAVLRGFAPSRALLVSAIEHASIQKTGELLGAATIPVNTQGVVQLEMLEQQLVALGDKKALVSVMLANNESGVIQPIAEIAAIAHRHGALLHTDGVQALGKIPLDMGVLGADMITISAHKAGGPVGAAALLVRDGIALPALLTGGGQESSRRAGTENVLAISGFAELVRRVAHCPHAAQWERMRNDLQQALLAIAPEALVFSGDAARLPNTLLIHMPGVSNETQLMHFDLDGFAVSAGSACSSGRIAPSHVLKAMGVPHAAAQSAIRISIGWQTTDAMLEAFANSWKTLYSRAGQKAA